VDALKHAMNKAGFPDAIRAEVCIANPEATQTIGFLSWLENECTQPLPLYLLENIKASWDTKTYRTTLEVNMAMHHERYTTAAMEWSEHFLLDTTQLPTDSLLYIWQQVRTPSARYAEANMYLERGAYAAAEAVMNGLPLEHELKTPDVLEQQRMLTWIAFVQGVITNNRVLEYDLTPEELDQLEALIGEEQDRPAVWISNLLCYHYERCRTIHSGGEEVGDPKNARAVTVVDPMPTATLRLAPNPSTNWMSIDHVLPGTDEEGRLVVRDIMGRVVYTTLLTTHAGQHVWDTRRTTAGTYSVELLDASGGTVLVERAVVQP
jgi:hypothetical protein